MVLPIILRKLAAAFFASLLPIILRKNWLHHHLKAFETSTRITLEIFPQMILPYTNQIISSTHEQSDFWTSITCFPFSFSLPFHFLSLFSCIFPNFFLSLSSHSHTKNPDKIGCRNQVQHPLFIGKYGRHHGTPTLGVP